MYSEKKLKFWAICQIIKKWFLVFVFSAVGTAIGFVITEFIIDVLDQIAMYRAAIIVGCTFLGFFIGLLFTSNINSNIQDAYWKIEVMKKLNAISYQLGKVGITDLTVVNNPHKLNKSAIEVSDEVKKEINNSSKTHQ